MKISLRSNIDCFLRNNNANTAAFLDTFIGRYHLPPQRLGKKSFILDLGTNIGLTVMHFKKLYPDAQIFGVEMDEGNFNLAIQNTRNLSDCTIIHAAIWNKTGVVGYTGTDAQSFQCQDIPGVQSVTVPSISLDDLIRKYSIDNIDYLKMDIEGAEAAVFEGECRWLDVVKSINIEIHHGLPMSFFIEKLTLHGFICRLSKTHWSAILAYRQ